MNLKIIVSYLSVYLIWGTSLLATRFLVTDVDIIWAFALRYLGASTILLATMLLFSPLRRGWRPDRSQLFNALGTGLLLLLCAVLLRSYSLLTISSSELAILGSLTPVFVAVFAWRMRGCKASAYQISGGLLGITGTVLLAAGSSTTGASLRIGVLLALAGVALWSFGMVLQKSLAHPDNPMTRVLLQNLAAGTALCVAGIYSMQSPVELIESLHGRSAYAFFHLTVLGSAFSTVAYMFLLQHEPLFRVSTTSFVIPVVAVIAGVFIGAEQISGATIAALSLSSLGTIIARWGEPILRILKAARSALRRRLKIAPLSSSDCQKLEPECCQL